MEEVTEDTDGMPGMPGGAVGGVRVPCVGGRPLPGYSAGLALKRCFDLTVSAVFLCAVFPVLYIAVGAAVKSSSPGPVLFRQRRHGKDGRTFTCLKFRTMRVNPSSDTLPASGSDPRVTAVGRFLRRTFIDELPQFVNVFLGDMSVVGPRPHMPYDTLRFSRADGRYMSRLSVRPGITGLAQVNGYNGEVRSPGDLEGRIRYDLEYIGHWSFLLDLRIFLRTFSGFLSGGQGRRTGGRPS